jgi:hypothetical protein
MFWAFEIPFKTGFTVYIYIYIYIERERERERESQREMSKLLGIFLQLLVANAPTT